MSTWPRSDVSKTASLQTPAGSVEEREAVTEAVIAAVADAEDVSPLELDPLACAIDPDALNALYEDGRDGVAVEFAYSGYEVDVSRDGRVSVAPLQP